MKFNCNIIIVTIVQHSNGRVRPLSQTFKLLLYLSGFIDFSYSVIFINVLYTDSEKKNKTFERLTNEM